MTKLENVERPRPRGIGIVAFGATKNLVDWDSPDWTYWSMNDSYHYFARKLSALFEMHPIAHYTNQDDPAKKNYIPDHEARMAAMQIRAYPTDAPGSGVYLAFPNPRIPNATIYPLDWIVEKFGRKYFHSSLAYMIPMAIVRIKQSQERGDDFYAPRIGLWGCDMQLGSDYAKERSCVEYWLSKAEDHGIEVYVPAESPLLKSSFLYGYEAAVVSDRERVIAARVGELSELLTDALNADRIANDRVSSIQGMLAEASFYQQHLTNAPPSGQPFR